MKKWLLFSLLIFALPVRAQTPAVGQKIEYRRDLPKSVAHLMPRGAKSLFWGQFTPKAGSATMAIHLFALQPKEELAPKYTFKGGSLSYHFALDIFEIAFKQFRHINRVPVTYALTGKADKIRANLFWLDETAKKFPILNFDCFSNEGNLLPGELGDGVLVTFAQGWTRKAVVQSWSYGMSNFSSISYALVKNHEGQMQVTTSETQNSGVTERKDYLWDGQRFSFAVGTERTIQPTF